MSNQFVGSAWIDSLLAAMQSAGLDMDAIANGVPGLLPIQKDAGHGLDVGFTRRLYHRADAVAADPLLGLRLGERIDDGATGFLSVLMWHAVNLRQVLDDLVTYQWAISENGGFEQRIENNEPGGEVLYVYEYLPVANAIPANRHQVLTVVSSVVGSVRRITRGAADVTAIRLPSSLDAKLIGCHLNCTVEVSPVNAAIVLRERDLETPIAHRDPQLYEVVSEYATAFYKRTHRRKTLVDEIKTCIRDNGFVAATLASVEAQIGLHRRILQRTLAEDATSFRQIKDEVVRDEAVRQLSREQAPIASIALALGYSEPSAFHRAFHNWFGITPGQFNRSDFYAH